VFIGAFIIHFLFKTFKIARTPYLYSYRGFLWNNLTPRSLLR
jgi:hypothetical protein